MAYLAPNFFGSNPASDDLMVVLERLSQVHSATMANTGRLRALHETGTAERTAKAVSLSQKRTWGGSLLAAKYSPVNRPAPIKYRTAQPLPQHMINMLTVGAFGNDMAAVPSLVGLAAVSSASSDTS